MSNKLILSMNGIGDVIHQKPIVADLTNKLVLQGHTVYATPSIPEFWEDIPDLKIVPSQTSLRTQKNHIQKTGYKFKYEIPSDISKQIDERNFENVIIPEYGYKQLAMKKLSITQALELTIGGEFLPEYHCIPDLQKYCRKNLFKKYGFDPKKEKIAVVRPVTLRKEWDGSGRAPQPQAVNWCANVLKKGGYTVVSIADVDNKNEWICGAPINADITLHEGELSIPETVELMRNASIVVGGSGFIVPISIALKTPVFVLFGGRGGYDSPFTLFDPRMDLRNVGWCLPTNFCRCFGEKKHTCDKTITDLDSQFYRFLQEQQK